MKEQDIKLELNLAKLGTPQEDMNVIGSGLSTEENDAREVDAEVIGKGSEKDRIEAIIQTVINSPEIEKILLSRIIGIFYSDLFYGVGSGITSNYVNEYDVLKLIKEKVEELHPNLELFLNQNEGELEDVTNLYQKVNEKLAELVEQHIVRIIPDALKRSKKINPQ